MSDSELETGLTKDLKSKSSAQPQKKCLRRSVTNISDSDLDSESCLTQNQPEPSIVRTPSPPPSASARVVENAYKSPDRLRLREALICGGETGFKAVEKCKTFVVSWFFIDDMPKN